MLFIFLQLILYSAYNEGTETDEERQTIKWPVYTSNIQYVISITLTYHCIIRSLMYQFENWIVGTSVVYRRHTGRRFILSFSCYVCRTNENHFWGLITVDTNSNWWEMTDVRWWRHKTLDVPMIHDLNRTLIWTCS